MNATKTQKRGGWAVKIRATISIAMLFISISFIGGLSSHAASNDTSTQTTKQNMQQEEGQIKGILMNYDTKEPVSGHQVQIFALKGTGKADGWQEVDDLKIEVTTLKNGAFGFEKIPPGKYVFMVKYRTSGSGFMPYFDSAIVRYENAKPVEVTLDSGRIIDLGKVWVQMR
jgi:hypothetical protein